MPYLPLPRLDGGAPRHERVVPDLCSSIRASRFGVVVSSSTSLCPRTEGMTKYPVGELPQVVEEARE